MYLQCILVPFIRAIIPSKVIQGNVFGCKYHIIYTKLLCCAVPLCINFKVRVNNPSILRYSKHVHGLANDCFEADNVKHLSIEYSYMIPQGCVYLQH